MLIRFENEHPTETEKQLFAYAGLYRVKYEDGSRVRYIPVHPNLSEGFPYLFEVDQEHVEWENGVAFDTCSETLFFGNGFDCDLYVLTLLCRRAEELGFAPVCVK